MSRSASSKWNRWDVCFSRTVPTAGSKARGLKLSCDCDQQITDRGAICVTICLGDRRRLNKEASCLNGRRISKEV